MIIKFDLFYKYAGYTAVVLASVYAFAVEFFGIEVPDTFHFAVLFSADGFHDVLFLPLPKMLYMATTAVFGNNILPLRLVCWLFYYGACLMTMFLLRQIMPDKKEMINYLTALSIALIPLYETTACNGNAMSSFFLVAVFVILYLAIKCNSLWFIGLSITMSLAVLSRFPNIVVLPFVLLFGCLAANDRRQMIYVVVSFLGSCLLTAVFYWLVWGSVAALMSDWHATMTVATDTSAADHSFATLVKEYLHTLKDFVWHLKSLLLPVICIFVIKETYSLPLSDTLKRIIRVLLYAVILLLIVYILRRNFSYNGHLGWDVTVALSALMIFACCMMSALAVFRHDRQVFALSLLPVLCSVSAAAGSDTGLLLMFAPMLSLMPFVVMQTYSILKKSDAREQRLMAIFSLLMLVFAYLYMRQGWQIIAIMFFSSVYVGLWFLGRKEHLSVMYLPVLERDMRWIAVSVYLLVISLTLTGKFFLSGDERPISECVYKFDESALCGIRSNILTVEWCHNVMSDYRRLCSEGQEVVFYGYMSNMFVYLSGEGRVQGVDFSFKPNERNMAAFVKAVQSRPAVMFCPLIPGSRKLYSMDTYQPMYDYLQQLGYSCIDKENYLIFYP